MPHTIRLRGPWEYEPVARASLLATGEVTWDDRGLLPGGTLHLPADWGAALGSDFRGLVRFTRRFACPTGLDEKSRVWLAIDNVDWQAVVTLNGSTLGYVQLAGTPLLPQWLGRTFRCSGSEPPLATDGVGGLLCPARFDIAALLQPRNELTIDVLLPAVAADAPPLARPGREDQPGGLIGVVQLEIESL